MSPEMKVLLKSIEEEHADWLGMVEDAKGDEMSLMITMCCGAVLGGLARRLKANLTALEARKAAAPGWQNMTNIGRTLEDCE